MFSGDTITEYYKRVYALMRTDLVTLLLHDIEGMMPFEVSIYFGQLKHTIEEIKRNKR